MSKKLLRYEAPKEDSGLYVVYFEFEAGKEYKAYLSKESFEVAMLEDKLQKAGVDIELLEEYKQAVWNEATENRNLD